MQSKIEQQVMASVGTIYTTRRLTSASALKLYVCVASLWGLGQLVWVARVFENLSRVGVEGAAQFALSAVTHAHLPVLLVLAVLAVTGASLLRDLLRLTTAPRATFA